MTAWTHRLNANALTQRVQRLLRVDDVAQRRATMVHDLDVLHGKVTALQDAFPPHTLHAAAVKANPVVSVLKALVDDGMGLECASLEEVHLSLAAGCAPERIVFDSPAKTTAELRFALENKLHLNVDNFDELQRIAALVPDTGAGHIGMRVNPQVGSGRIAITSVAARVSKFGVALDENRARLLEAYATYDWLDGVHIHVGSQGCSLDQLWLAAERVAQFCDDVKAHCGRALTQVDIGGGLPVVYLDDDSAPDVADYVAGLRERVPTLFGDDVRLLTEFGRALHANCGFALSRVEYVKGTSANGGDDEQMGVLHLGADAFMRPVYQPNDWPHSFLVFDKDGQLKPSATTVTTSLAGPLCFGGDFIARDVQLPRLQEGDWVVVRDTGAYTLSMWSRHCSRGLPPVVGLRGDDVTTLFAGEQPKDVVDFWS